MVDGQWSEVKYCRNCGAELLPGGEFCQKCGNKVAEPPIPSQGSGYAMKHCVNCGAQMDARAEICPKCGIRASSVPSPQTPPQQYPPQGMPPAQKSAGLAAVLSFIIPGLGQIYNGEIGKGIGILIGFIVCWCLFFFLIPIVIAIVLWVWGIYDAYKTAERNNQAAMRGSYQQPYKPY